MKGKKGISLIVLIITIIVVIILAAVVILTITKNNPVESAKEATFKEDVRSFQDELNMYISNEYTKLQGMRDSKINTTNIPATYKEMQTYISSYKEKYDKKLGIEDDKIVYFPKEVTKNEKKWLEDLNISVSSNIPFDPVEWDENATPEDCFLWDNDGITIIGLNEEKISGVTKIRIPSKCKAIRSDFYSSSLTEDYRNLINKMITIEIPDTVTEIGSYAFYEWNNLENVVMSKKITKIGEYAFFRCYSLTNITIPGSVTSIGDYAFAICSSLTGITIPNSVTSIGKDAFQDCSKLTSINVSDNNRNYSSIDGVLFNKDKTEIIQYPEEKESKSYKIPNSVTSIGDWEFYICSSLTNITIPESVTSIGECAFASCFSLTSITYNGTQSQWNKISKASSWKNNSAIKTITCTDGVITL